MHELIYLDGMGYSVMQFWQDDRLSDNQFLKVKPNGIFVFVRVTIENGNNVPRGTATFSLIDQDGAEYEQHNMTSFAKDGLGVFERLNPGIRKSAVIVFDVPFGRVFKLKIGNALWQGRVVPVLVELLISSRVDPAEPKRERYQSPSRWIFENP